MPSGAGFIIILNYSDGVARSEPSGNAHLAAPSSWAAWGVAHVDALFRGTTEAELRAKVVHLLEHDMSVILEPSGPPVSVSWCLSSTMGRCLKGRKRQHKMGLLTADRIRDFVVEKLLLVDAGVLVDSAWWFHAKTASPSGDWGRL